MAGDRIKIRVESDLSELEDGINRLLNRLAPLLSEEMRQFVQNTTIGINNIKEVFERLGTELAEGSNRIQEILSQSRRLMDVLSSMNNFSVIRIDPNIRSVIKELREIARGLGLGIAFDTFEQPLRRSTMRVHEFRQAFQRLVQLIEKEATKATKEFAKSLDTSIARSISLSSASLDQYVNRLKQAGVAVDNLGKRSQILGNAQRTLFNRFQELNRALENISSEILRTAVVQNKSTDAIYEQIGALLQQKEAIESLIDEVAKNSDISLYNAEANKKYEDSVKKLIKHLGAYERNITQLGKAHRVSTAEVNRSRLAALSFTQIIQDLPFGLIAVVNNVQQFSVAMAALARRQGDVSKAFKSFIKELFSLKSFLVPFTVSLLTSVVLFWDRFKEQIDNVVLALQGVPKEFRELRKLINEINVSAPFETAVAEIANTINEQLKESERITKRIKETQESIQFTKPGFEFSQLKELSEISKEANESQEKLNKSIKASRASIVEIIKENKAFISILKELSSGATDVENAFNKVLSAQKLWQELIGDENLASMVEITQGLLSMAEKAPQEFEKVAKSLGFTFKSFKNNLSLISEELTSITSTSLKAASSLSDIGRVLSSLKKRFPESAALVDELAKEYESARTELDKFRILQERAALGDQKATNELARLTGRVNENVVSVEEANRVLSRRIPLITSLVKKSQNLRNEIQLMTEVEASRFGQLRELEAAHAELSAEIEKLITKQRLGLEIDRLDLRNKMRQRDVLEVLIDRYRTLTQLNIQSEIAQMRLEFEKLTGSVDDIAEATRRYNELQIRLAELSGYSREEIKLLSATLKERLLQTIIELNEQMISKDPFFRMARSIEDLMMQSSFAQLRVEGLSAVLSQVGKLIQEFAVFRERAEFLEGDARRRFVEQVARSMGIETDGKFIEDVIEDVFNRYREAIRTGLEEFVGDDTQREIIQNAIIGQFLTIPRSPLDFRFTGEIEARIQAFNLQRTANAIRTQIDLIRDAFKDMQLPPEVATIVSELERLAAAHENAARRIIESWKGASGSIANVAGTISNVYKFMSEQILSPVQDIVESLRVLGEKEIAERKRQLVQMGFTESEAAEIARREGNRKIKAYKETMKAIIWIQGLGELAGITASIATSVPWPFNLALIALQTAATYARIRARIAQLDRIGSIGGGSAGLARIDMGRVVQQNPVANQSARAASRAVVERGEDPVVTELKRIRKELEGGLRVDETTAERIVQQGVAKTAYVR